MPLIPVGKRKTETYGEIPRAQAQLYDLFNAPGFSKDRLFLVVWASGRRETQTKKRWEGSFRKTWHKDDHSVTSYFGFTWKNKTIKNDWWTWNESLSTNSLWLNLLVLSLQNGWGTKGKGRLVYPSSTCWKRDVGVGSGALLLSLYKSIRVFWWWQDCQGQMAAQPD